MLSCLKQINLVIFPREKDKGVEGNLDTFIFF